MGDSNLVPGDSEILRREIPRFDFANPPVDPIELADQLARAVLEHDGIGLSANQIGLDHRLFVIRANPILACFNPRTVAESPQTVTLEEGCLSFPGLVVKVKRPHEIRVR